MNTTNTSLSLSSLKKLVPAAFGTAPAEHCSEKYQFINSADIIERLMKEGFVPVRANQNKSRVAEDALVTRHAIRFRRSNAKPILGEVFPEVGFMNGHNGSVRFQMFGGLFRLVCSNGMVAGTGASDMMASTRHFGDITEVVEQSYKIIDRMKEMTSKVEAFQGIKLPKDWMLPFAGNAAAIAFGEEHQLAKDPSPLLIARRDADIGDDLWRVFNVVQENIIRGGMEYNSPNGRHVMTRGITRVKRDVAVNAQLWDLAENVASDLNPAFRKAVSAEMLA